MIPARRTAEVTPAVCKASAGAVEHIPIAQVRNLADFLGAASAAGYWIYGAAGEGSVAVHAASTTPDAGVVLVMGSEGSGLRPRVAAACDAARSGCRCAGGSSRSTSAPRPPRSIYEIVRQRDVAKRG